MLPNISPAEAQNMLRENRARLVDVREADELAAVRIAGAIPATAPPKTATCCKSWPLALHGRWKAA